MRRTMITIITGLLIIALIIGYLTDSIIPVTVWALFAAYLGRSMNEWESREKKETETMENENEQD